MRSRRGMSIVVVVACLLGLVTLVPSPVTGAVLDAGAGSGGCASGTSLVWSATDGPGSRLVRVASGADDTVLRPAVTSDLWVDHGDAPWDDTAPIGRSAAVSPDGASVAFVAPDRGPDGDGTPEVHVAPLVGGPAVRLSRAELPGRLSWAPDGGHVAWVERTPSDALRTLVGPVGGGEPFVLPGLVDGSLPAFSPDGSLVAWIAGIAGATEVRVAPVGGGTPTVVSGGSHAAGSWPRWSHDSAHVAWVDAGDLLVAGADGATLETLDTGVGRRIAWSPTRAELAYTAAGEVRVGEPGGAPVAVAAITPGLGTTTDPEWSTDGEQVAIGVYEASEFPATGVLLGDRAATGSTLTWLHSLSFATSIAWSPVDAHFVASDGQWVVLVHPGDEPGPVAPSAGGDLEWSADGTAVLTSGGNLVDPFAASGVYLTGPTDHLFSVAGFVGATTDVVVLRGGVEAAARTALGGDGDGVPSGLVAGAVTSDDPVVSPDGGRVAVAAVGPGSPRLVTADPGGGAEVEVAEVTDPFSVTWSPDAAELAWIDDDPVGDGLAVFVATADGAGEPRRLAGGMPEPHAYWRDRAAALSWSPDGGRIAWAGPVDGGSSAWVAPADGSGAVRRLDATDPGPAPVVTPPVWRGDGRGVAWAAAGLGSGAPVELRWADLTGTDPAAVVWEEHVGRIDVDPDLRLVADADGTVAALSAIVTMPEAGEVTSRLVTVDLGSAVARDVGVGRDPAWSPDGRTLAYSAWTIDAHERESGEIRTVGADGSWSSTPFAQPGMTSPYGPVPAVVDRAPAWSPDGDRLAFERQVRQRGSADTLAAVPVRVPRTVRVGSAAGGAAALVAEGGAPAWSADGTRLAVAAADGPAVVDVVDATATLLGEGSWIDDLAFSGDCTVQGDLGVTVALVGAAPPSGVGEATVRVTVTAETGPVAGSVRWWVPPELEVIDLDPSRGSVDDRRWSLPALAAGDSATLDIAVYGRDGGPGGSDVEVGATVRARGFDTDPSNDHAAAALRVRGSAGFHPVPTSRVLDTRKGLGAPEAPLGPGGVLDLDLVGHGGVPDGATAVVLNLTGVGPTEATHLTVFPGATAPLASNLNLAAGQTAANLVVAAVDGDGSVRIRNERGRVEVVADVAGWFDDGAGLGLGLRTEAATRLLDTRRPPGPGVAPVRVGPGASVVVPGAPTTGAAVLNLTAVAPSAATHLTVRTTATGTSTASHLNLAAGETRSNLVIVPAGAVTTVTNHAGDVDVVVDRVAWFADGDGLGFHALPPGRALDTRHDVGLTGPFGPGAERTLALAGVAGVPAGAAAVLANVTAVTPSEPTHLTVWAAGGTRPPTSSLNAAAGAVVPALVLSPTTGPGTALTIRNQAGVTHVVADVSGWFG